MSIKPYGTKQIPNLYYYVFRDGSTEWFLFTTLDDSKF